MDLLLHHVDYPGDYWYRCRRCGQQQHTQQQQQQQNTVDVRKNAFYECYVWIPSLLRDDRYTVPSQPGAGLFLFLFSSSSLYNFHPHVYINLFA